MRNDENRQKCVMCGSINLRFKKNKSYFCNACGYSSLLPTICPSCGDESYSRPNMLCKKCDDHLTFVCGN